MAYVSHSAYPASRDVSRIDLGLIGRAALAALVAGAAIVALSGASTQGEPSSATFAKGDRLAAASRSLTPSPAGYTVDAASMTTTIQKGAASPLSSDSPYAAAAK